MRLYLKIILITVGVLLCLLIFFFFLIYNFPYNVLVQRINYNLKKETDVSMEVSSIKYHLPNKWLIYGVNINLPNRYGKVLLSKVKFKLDILNFSKIKRVYISVKDIKIVESNIITGNLSSLNLESSFVFSDLRNSPFKGIKRVKLIIGDGKVNSIEYSGFKISNFKILNVLIELLNTDGKFNFKSGVMNSDTIKGSLKGYLSENYMDVKINLLPSDDFFTRYPDLKPILGSIIRKNGVKD